LVANGCHREGEALGRLPGRLTLSEDDRRLLATWAADCAERTLRLFEASAPADSRPRDAVAGARAFARGELRIGPARALAIAAHAAARAIDDPAAIAAARATGHAVATAHMASHARGAPAYAAMAVGLARPGSPQAVADEVAWQRQRITPEVRACLRRLPAPPRSSGFLGRYIAELHAEVTGDAG
jgi:hypothetical protein